MEQKGNSPVKTTTQKKLTWQTVLSLTILLLGILLCVMNIVVESEPGAIPLLLIMAGSGWYFFSRVQSRIKDKVES